MKNNKGITLIALVVTIIVLLILAGVSIAMLSGDNGILTNAQKARDNSAAGTLDEVVKIAIGNIMTSNLGWPVDDTSTNGVNEGVTITDESAATEAQKQKDLKTQIKAVNPSIDPTISAGTTAWTVSATINGKPQTVYVTISNGAVSTTNPDVGS